MNKARMFGANISMLETFKLRRKNCLDENLLTAIGLSQQNYLGFPIDELAKINLIGGDPAKTVKGVLYAQSKKVKLTLQDASYADIVGKNIPELINEMQGDLHLEFQSGTIVNGKGEGFSYHFIGRYSNTFNRVCFPLKPHEIDVLKERVRKIITESLLQYGSIDFDVVGKSILSEHLSQRFWGTKMLIIKDQHLILSPIE